MNTTAPEGAPRRIRSFVRREGRMTVAQKQALEKFWPRYGVEVPPPSPSPVTTGEGTIKSPLPSLRGRVGEGALNLAKIFGRDAPRILEIGFGNGEGLLAQALAHPERDYLGVEVHRPGVGHLLSALHTQALTNVRVFCMDAVDVLQALAPANLDGVQLYFPDPWHKTRHHKRRLVQPAFASLVARVLKPGGRWLLATDWAPYAEQMREILNAQPEFVNLAADWNFVPRPAERGLTRFERRGLKLGHAVFDLAYGRK